MAVEARTEVDVEATQDENASEDFDVTWHRVLLSKRRYGARLYRPRGEVEELWELTAARYASLHLDAPERCPGAFRGLRYCSWTDPFAALGPIV